LLKRISFSSGISLSLETASPGLYGESAPEPFLQFGSGILLGVIRNLYPENVNPQPLASSEVYCKRARIKNKVDHRTYSAYRKLENLDTKLTHKKELICVPSHMNKTVDEIS